MKRYGNIYQHICTMENLRAAHWNAKRGKGRYREIKIIEQSPDRHLRILQEQLINKTYRTSKYSIFTKQDQHKEREIYRLPYFPDRVCQWAIMLQIEPIFIKSFIYDTYASIPGRGIHKALCRVAKAVKNKKETCYCLKFDIKKYYPSINHEILKNKLRRKFKDKNLLWLLEEIIDSTHPGIPIGNYLSQYLANYYLSSFDHCVKEGLRTKHYYRYMDDIVILNSNKTWLHKIKTLAEEYLWNELQLKIKENWQVFPVEKRGIDFVGYRIFPEYTLLRKRIAKEYKKKMRKYSKQKEFRKRDVCSIYSYLGWLKWANCRGLAEKYSRPLMKGLNKEMIK